MATDASRPLLARAADGPVYYGWVIVACCFAGSLLTFGIIYSFSVFFGHIAETFQQSQANTSLVFSLQSFVTYGAAAVLGLFIDRYGARWLLVVAAVLVGAGMVGAARLTAFAGVVVAYGVVTATGLSLVYVISYATAPRWFDRRRGMATALATSGGGVGILVGPPVASDLVDAFGWQDAYLVMTAGAVATLLVVALLLADRPRDVGLDPAALEEFPDGGGAPTAAADEWGSQLADVTETARSGPFLLVFLAYFGLGAPIFFVAAHVVEFTESVGLGQGLGVLALSIVGGMNVFGKFVAGPVSDRIGIARTLSACGVLLGVPLLVMAFVPQPAVVLVMVVVFGLGYGGSIALLSPTIAELFGTDDLNSLFGLTSLAFAVTGSVVPFLAGAGFDAFGSYTLPLVLGGLLGLASVPALEYARRQRTTT